MSDDKATMLTLAAAPIYATLLSSWPRTDEPPPVGWKAEAMRQALADADELWRLAIERK